MFATFYFSDFLLVLFKTHGHDGGWNRKVTLKLQQNRNVKSDDNVIQSLLN